MSLLRTQSLKVLPVKPGVGQYIAMHATFTARHYSLANFYPSSAFTCIFSKNLSRVFPVLAVANTGSSVGPKNKTGHPAHQYSQLRQVHVLDKNRLSQTCVIVFLGLHSKIRRAPDS